MNYTIQYLDENDAVIGSSTHKGTPESAVAAARYALFDRQADGARIIDEAGLEVGRVRVDA